jgi:hypothetical protein
MSNSNHGTVREEQVRDHAARLGVADFVYIAAPVRKGNAQREVSGDGLLIVGERGAILQVKAREPMNGQIDSEEKARAWIRKNAHRAKDQGLGVRRELTRRRKSGNPLVVTPVRAIHLPLDVRFRYAFSVSLNVEDWPIIVIVDHPRTPAMDLGFLPGVAWFTFHDWLELQRRLRSTSATIHYVQRIMTDRIHAMLGCEAERYASMSAADEMAARGSHSEGPYLAHPQDFDDLGTDLFHDVLNKVWPHDGVIPWKCAGEYRVIVEFLDNIPPDVQSRVGRWFLEKRRQVATGSRQASGLALLERRDRLVYACSQARHWNSAHDWHCEITLLAALRHKQALESGAADETKTLAIAALAEEREDQTGVSYSFVLMDGREADLDIPADLRRSFERRYGIHSHREGRTIEVPGDGSL